MTRYLVYLDQASAQAAVNQIDANGRPIFQQFGYAIAPNGDVVEKNPDGTPNLAVVYMHTWATPWARLDGKWVVLHPENYPSSNRVVDAQGTTAAQAVMSGVSYSSIEDYADAWVSSQPAP